MAMQHPWRRESGLLRKVAGVALLVVLLAGLVEGVAFIAYFLVNKKPFSFETVRQTAATVIGDSTAAGSGQGGQADYLVHPYFGYVSKVGSPSTVPEKEANLARAYGFDTNGQLMPDHPAMFFTVAVVGGSVAKYFAANMAEVLAGYLEKLPQAKGKSVRILGLGNYSYKEPQQLNIVNDLIAEGAHFDLVINLDGFNEVAHPAVHNLPNNVSPFFPSGWADRTGEVSSNDNLIAIGRITHLKDMRQALARLYMSLGHGVTAGFVWSSLDLLLARQIYKLEVARLANHEAGSLGSGSYQGMSASGKISYGPHKDYAPEALYPDLAAHWAICSAILNNTVVGAGGKYFHFLQPNQYDSGSKVLSEEERNKYFNLDLPYKPGVERGYGLLRKAGEALSGSGVEFVDASGLFAQNAETLYLDDCCHYNQKGEEILARYIGNYILSAYEKKQGPASLEIIQEQLQASIGNAQGADRLLAVYDLAAATLDGNITVEGLGSYEENDIRHFRWGLGPSTRITFVSPPKAKVRLSAQFLSATPGQAVDVMVNGVQAGQWSDVEYAGTATAMSDRNMTCDSLEGPNQLELRYKSWLGDGSYETLERDPRKMAVMFQELKIELMPR